jgi:hypothetical protein
VVIASSMTLGAQTQRFFPDDPIWREPLTQDVKNAVRYEPDLAYQTLENLFWRPGDKVLGQRAKNINSRAPSRTPRAGPRERPRSRARSRPTPRPGAPPPRCDRPG